MCRTTFMPSGIRLQQLIQNQYKEILAREKNNDKFIHLYDIGAYWVAFERSACRLSGLFSKSELTLFRVPDLLFSMEYGHSSCSIGNTLKNPSKASACSQTPYPWAFRLKDWVQESFSWGLECFSRTDLPPILRESFFLKDIFRLKHFTMHILQPECRQAGCLRSG